MIPTQHDFHFVSHIGQETLKFWEQDVCHTLEMLISVDNAQYSSTECMEATWPQANGTENITKATEATFHMLSLSALQNMWKRAHAPLGGVRTSKGGGCTFGIYYGHSAQGSVQRRTLHPPDG